MNEHLHNGWKIRLFHDSALAVRDIGSKRVGIARKRGETAEDLLVRMCALIDRMENAITSNAFLRKEVERVS